MALYTKHCANCGAPVTTEICPYCNARTGIDSHFADMEYPVIECKEANVGFWNVVFPMIFAFMFGIFGFLFPFAFAVDGELDFIVFVFLIPFGLVSVGAFIVGIRPLIRYIIVRLKGKEIDATVYGYMSDIYNINERPSKMAKLLINTSDGPRFVLYSLGSTVKPYKVNSRIKLKAYKNIFLIEQEKKQYF